MMTVGIRRYFYSIRYKFANRHKAYFKCPICNYFGPFIDRETTTGLRKHAKCPRCTSFERHRLQKLVLDTLAKQHTFSDMRMLHFAPETFFHSFLIRSTASYTSVDLSRTDVDIRVDMRNLSFYDCSFDLIYASHVLEHIKEDEICLSEIQRVLSKKGVAILPVPIVAEKTIEYPAPNPKESGHVRAPGPDYYERYSNHFSKVVLYSSKDFSNKYQSYVYENRSHWPNENMPLRKAMNGEKHLDIVAVCYS